MRLVERLQNLDLCYAAVLNPATLHIYTLGSQLSSALQLSVRLR